VTAFIDDTLSGDPDGQALGARQALGDSQRRAVLKGTVLLLSFDRDSPPKGGGDVSAPSQPLRSAPGSIRGVPPGIETARVKAIRVLLVDDQPTVRRGLMMRLQLEPDITVVGEAQNGLMAIRAAGELRPDVMVMDYEMPEMNGIEAAQALTSAGTAVSVVMLSIHDNSSVRRAAACAGVRSFVAKHEPSEHLLAAIREAARRNGEEDTS
jgi:CheY-like chemotaxis protein